MTEHSGALPAQLTIYDCIAEAWADEHPQDPEVPSSSQDPEVPSSSQDPEVTSSSQDPEVPPSLELRRHSDPRVTDAFEAGIQAAFEEFEHAGLFRLPDSQWVLDTRKDAARLALDKRKSPARTQCSY